MLVAVSGGADSVALLLALHAIKKRSGGRGALHVAHFDHRQRGAASAADAEWVRHLAEKLGCESHFGSTTSDTTGSEEALRELRREFLLETACSVGARWIATGHHADDQAETVLFRVLRGTGIQGVAGIAGRSQVRDGVCLVRPLLGVRRNTLQEYLSECDQHYREDQTNRSTEPTRNWLRHELLPAAAARMGQSVPDALCRLAVQAEETQQAIAHFAQLAVAAADPKFARPNSLSFLSAPLVSLPTAVRIESMRIIWRDAGWGEQAMTANHWRTLATWVQNGGELPQLPGGVSGRRESDTVVLSRMSSPLLP